MPSIAPFHSSLAVEQRLEAEHRDAQRKGRRHDSHQHDYQLTPQQPTPAPVPLRSGGGGAKQTARKQKAGRRLAVLEGAERVERHSRVEDLSFMSADDVYWVQRRVDATEQADQADHVIAARAANISASCASGTARSADRQRYAATHARVKAVNAIPGLKVSGRK